MRPHPHQDGYDQYGQQDNQTRQGYVGGVPGLVRIGGMLDFRLEPPSNQDGGNQDGDNFDKEKEVFHKKSRAKITLRNRSIRIVSAMSSIG